MRFALVDAVKAEFPIQRLCGVLGVSQSGYFAWKGRPACRRQREDLVLLAHVRSAFALSNGTYGSPRMTRELQDDGLMVGRRRTARLMRNNGMKARQKRRFRRTTAAVIPGRWRPTSSTRTSRRSGPMRSGPPTSPTSGPARVGCIWQLSSICLPAALSAGRWLIACIGTSLLRHSEKRLPSGAPQPV
jgi:transposase InsO family protein